MQRSCQLRKVLLGSCVWVRKGVLGQCRVRSVRQSCYVMELLGTFRSCWASLGSRVASGCGVLRWAMLGPVKAVKARHGKVCHGTSG